MTGRKMRGWKNEKKHKHNREKNKLVGKNGWVTLRRKYNDNVRTNDE
jgi:hypothetical protein